MCILLEKKSIHDLFNFSEHENAECKMCFPFIPLFTPPSITTPLLFNKLARYKEMCLFSPPLQRPISVRTPPREGPLFSGSPPETPSLQSY